jgi:hypothetical protein
MTKRILAKTIVEMVDNFRFVGDEEIVIVKAIESFLNLLEPKDRERFAQWGTSKERSTAKECWPNP